MRRVAIIVMAMGMLIEPAFAWQKPARAPRRIDRLLQMTPEQRERALAQVPPARREALKNRIAQLESMPPAQRRRVITRQMMLQDLPPRQRQKVRQSMQDFLALPQQDRPRINREVQRMARMNRSELRTYTDSEGFRSRFTPEQREMIGNLVLVTPARPIQ